MGKVKFTFGQMMLAMAVAVVLGLVWIATWYFTGTKIGRVVAWGCVAILASYAVTASLRWLSRRRSR